MQDQNPDIVFITETLPKIFKYDVREAELGIDGYALYMSMKIQKEVFVYT